MDDLSSTREERLAQLFRAAYDRMRERVYAQARSSGFADLRPAHSSVLRYIDPHGSRAVELAERAGMTKQSMAYLTDNLARFGYVTVEPDPTDGRAKLVRLTRRGEQAVATLTRVSQEVEQDIARSIGAQRLEAMRAAMRDLLAAL